MRYLVLACDYDGTLATRGRLATSTAAALERCRASGRRVLLVTGREMGQLREVCPRLDLFDLIVAENGALLVDPASGRERPLALGPPERFVQALRRQHVVPLSVGRVIVATRDPFAPVVLDAIRRSRLEWHLIFNKGSVMALPSGVNKATGMLAAIAELGIPAHAVVGVGDAENDHAFLAACGCAVAVANALPSLKAEADLVTVGDHGAGVEELVGRLLADDLAGVVAPSPRHPRVPGDASGPPAAAGG
jgi:hydroxymethylpyrimidine pyrophosphatase-like HAD family hydrolase